jgi:hypothetical protein
VFFPPAWFPVNEVTSLPNYHRPAWADGPGVDAAFFSANASGYVFFADSTKNVIRTVSPQGLVTTLAGNGNPGWVDGVGTYASFYIASAAGLAVNASGFILCADPSNNRIRVVSPSGFVSTLAGSGLPTWADGLGSHASFNSPAGVALTPSGDLLVADEYNHRIRVVTPLGQVTTIAGNGDMAWADGLGSQASFYLPQGVVMTASGYAVVADRSNVRIRAMSPQGVVTTIAGNGVVARIDGFGTQASFMAPYDVAVNASDILVADSISENDVIHVIHIRKISSIPPYQSTCLPGSSRTGSSRGCSLCPVGSLCPNGTSASMIVHAASFRTSIRFMW